MDGGRAAVGHAEVGRRSGTGDTSGRGTPEYLVTAFTAGLGLVFCRWFAGRNYLTFALTGWTLLLGSSAVELLLQRAYRVQGRMVAGLLLVMPGWAAGPALATRAGAAR